MKNVFSDNSEELSMLIFTEDFLDDSSAMKYFCNANKILNIRIYFMPVLSTKMDCELSVGKYSYFRDGLFTDVVMAFDGCSSVVSIHSKLPEDIEDKEIFCMSEEKILHGELTSTMFDYIVTKNFSNEYEKCEVPVISLERCKEILRLFLVYRKEFRVSEHLNIDETFYYIYKHKQLFSEFQNYWSAVIKCEEACDWSDALDNRLCMMTICLDQCKIEALKKQNNTTVMHLKYHLSYLMLLITGTFDNLAWIINNKYNLQSLIVKYVVSKTLYFFAMRQLFPLPQLLQFSLFSVLDSNTQLLEETSFLWLYRSSVLGELLWLFHTH